MEKQMSTKVENQVEALMKETSAWTTGHFLLSSGLHSDQYMQCQKVMQYPEHGLTLARLLMQKVSDAGLAPTVIVGPALGAVHWEVYCAIAANQIAGRTGMDQIRAVFAEKVDDGVFAIRRGIEIKAGEKVMVVEDVTTTGGSAKKVVQLLESMGADVIAVGAIIDRSGGVAQFGRPFISLLQLQLETYTADACPLCKAGGRATKPGSSILTK
jgi:orotate phosphoribosyltransferase